MLYTSLMKKRKKVVYTRSMKKRKKDTETKASNQTYSYLPFELILLIMKRLSLKENILASAVCKTWHKACVSVRVEDPTTWLMIFPPGRRTYKLYNLSLSKSRIHKFPELRGSHLRYSKDGWLLMDNSNRTETFFFNPFTREHIQVPWPDLKISYTSVFSCPPTSNSCVIFLVYHISKRYITIKTYYPATKECTTLLFPNRLPLRHGGFQDIVFSNGVFYCLTSIGSLGMLDLSTSSWSLLPQRAPICRKINKRVMTEYQGDILLIYAADHEKPIFFKLDLTNQKWTEKTEVEGLTFYFGFQSVVTTKSNLVFKQRMMFRYYYWYHVWIKPLVNV